MNHYVPPMQRALLLPTLKVLMLVQWVVVLPFLRYLPVWLGGVLALVMVWRWRVMHGDMRPAPLWLKVVSVLVGVAGLFASGLTSYTLDSAVALCLLGYLLKSLEVLRRRDAVFQIYLGFFLTGVYLLYHYSPLGALTAIAMLLANTLALHAVTADRGFEWRRGLKYSLGLLGSAIPIMVVGFLFFPRLPPLWTIPNDQRGAKTGMTDELTPGNVADLARDNSPAFRVRFDGERPPRNQWYWRGSTLGAFDGQSWRAFYSEQNRRQWPRGRLPESTGRGDQHGYTVIMEASQQHWLYFLDWPTSVQADNARILPDGRAARQESLNQAYRYRATSSTGVEWSGENALSWYRNLPNSGNERLRAWARERFDAVDSDEAAFVNTVLDTIRDEPFFYTLQPPLYQGSNSISDFWFGDRRGFCSHYASALGFMARAVGIPSRLVGGYLGGVYNPNGDFVQVRQMEAHVWVELWLNERWVRVDPTAAVAPDRVELNLDDWLGEENPSELPLGSRVRRGLSIFNQAGLWWGSIQYQWQVLVLNYQDDSAMGLVESHLGRINPWQAAGFMAAFLVALGVIMAWLTGLLRLPKRLPEPWASLRRVEKRLGERKLGETVRDYTRRKASEYPSQEEALMSVTTLIENLAYNHDRHSKKRTETRLRHLVQAIKKT